MNESQNNVGTLELRTVYQLCKGENGKQFVFEIPTYQRGFRWTDQVRKLLDDLYEFFKTNPGNDDFYCLQPIVVRKKSEDETSICYETIDGQQRLTTIKLILQIMKTDTLFEMRYERSKDTKGSVFDEFYTENAKTGIKEWFEKNDAASDVDLRVELSRILKNKTKVIWQEMAEGETRDELKRFQNINSRIIRLSSSELTKAMLLNNKFYQGNEGKKRYRAGVWDEFTTYMEEDSFKSFIGEMNMREVAADYLVELEYIDAKGNKDIPLRIEDVSDHFEDILLGAADNTNEVFDKLRKHFRNFQDWYANPAYYNYIGYLLNETETKITPHEIGMEYANNKRSHFEKWLAGKTYDSIKITYEQRGLDLDYNYNGNIIKKILLIFAVRTANKAGERFGFCPDGGWSIEHVFAQNMKFKKSGERIAFLQDHINQIEHHIIISSDSKRRTELEELKAGIQNYNEEDETKSADLFGKFITLIELYHFDKENIHRPGNLALLGRNLNSRLQNHPFCEKRKILIENGNTRDNLPLATQRVFNKAYTTAKKPYGIEMTLWSDDDRLAYEEAIRRELDQLKEEANGNG